MKVWNFVTISGNGPSRSRPLEDSMYAEDWRCEKGYVWEEEVKV